MTLAEQIRAIERDLEHGEQMFAWLEAASAARPDEAPPAQQIEQIATLIAHSRAALAALGSGELN